jgi:hypothetical protein
MHFILISCAYVMPGDVRFPSFYHQLTSCRWICPNLMACCPVWERSECYLKRRFPTEALDPTRRNVPSPPKVTNPEARQWRASSRNASPKSRLPTPPGSRKTPPISRGLSDHLWLTVFGVSPLQPLGGGFLCTLLSRRQRYLHRRRGQFQSSVHRGP